MNRQKRDNFIARILYILVGAVCGFFMILSADPEKLFGTPGEFALQMAFCMVLIFVAYFIQAIIHELGHLVFGLLTGYKFISFRHRITKAVFVCCKAPTVAEIVKHQPFA